MEQSFQGTIVAVSLDSKHAFSKVPQASIRLLEGLGVEGDAHCGETVKHRSRVRVNPDQPNLRQVHLIHQELFEEVGAQGFAVKASELGENVTTQGIDLLSLPTGAILHLGNEAQVEITGLRNPCMQIESWQKGLLDQVLERQSGGRLVRKTGVMGIVLKGGLIKPGDEIRTTLPPEPWKALERV